MRSSTRHVLFFVAFGAIALPLAWFFLSPWDAYVLVGLYGLSVLVWSLLAAAQVVNRIRYGRRMTFEEILLKPAPRHRVRLLRYHLGWSPGKITAELNRHGQHNEEGEPWHEEEVQRIIRGVRRIV